MLKTLLSFICCNIVTKWSAEANDEWPMIHQYQYVPMKSNYSPLSFCFQNENDEIGIHPYTYNSIKYHEDIMAIHGSWNSLFLPKLMCPKCVEYNIEHGLVYAMNSNIKSDVWSGYKIHLIEESLLYMPTTTFMVRDPLNPTQVEAALNLFQFLPGSTPDSIANFAKLQTIQFSKLNPLNQYHGSYIKTQITFSKESQPIILILLNSNILVPTIWPRHPISSSQQHTTLRAKVFDISIPSKHQLTLSLYAQSIPMTTSMTLPQNPSIPPSSNLYQYSSSRKFTRIISPNGFYDGVLFQDEHSGMIYLIWFLSNRNHDIVAIKNRSKNHQLIAATSDGGTRGDVIIITAEQTNTEIQQPQRIVIRKFTHKGQLRKKKLLDTSAAGLDVYQIASHTSLAWNLQTNQIAWMFTRQTHLKQSGTIVLLDGTSFQIIGKKGRTSTQSWTNYVHVRKGNNQKKHFIGMDLGIDAPRSLQLHSFDNKSRLSKNILYFKALHGKTEKSPLGTIHTEFKSITTHASKFYQWSQDERIYMEMAQPPLLETKDSILIFFSAEKDCLNHKNTLQVLNSPRNIGMVIIAPDFQEIPSQSVGEQQTLGYYDVHGTFYPQENKGIIWLTNLIKMKDKNEWENAIRVKSAQVEPDLICVLYEVWSTQVYKRTEILGIDSMGVKVFGPIILPYSLRLYPSDTVEVKDGQIIFHGTDELGKNLIQFRFQVNYDSHIDII